MMKISILTFHNRNSYGGALQAYALMKFIESLNHEVKIIDYDPLYNFWHVNAGSIYYKLCSSNKLLHILYCIVRCVKEKLSSNRRELKCRFEVFITSNMPQTKRYSSSKQLRNMNDHSDVYIVGSDQVWNEKYTYSDNSYFFDFLPKGVKKISYAASFGKNIPSTENKKNIASYLTDFAAISVREKSAKTILENCGINNVSSVIDPVFLLSKNDWTSLIVKTEHKEKYILVYSVYDNNELKEYAEKLRKACNLKIKSINHIYMEDFSGYDENIKNAGPVDFLGLIYFSEYVITDSFHGTAFSIIFGKEFFSFVSDRISDSRITDLLNTLCIENRIVYDGNIVDPSHTINWQFVRSKVELEIFKSKVFLENAINENNYIAKR